MTVCGLDFGTSHSTISIYDSKGAPKLVSIDGDTVVRSSIFFDSEVENIVYGQRAIDSYLNSIPGRLMVGLKSILGSSLMDEKTAVLGRLIDYKTILGIYLDYLKIYAEQETGQRLTKVVAGRPVNFHNDNADKNQKSQDVLEDVLRSIGFKDIVFQYEPVAAAYDYWQQVTKETKVLIADLGGGTCDFTVVKLPPYTKGEPEILGNTGIRLGGTNLDTLLSIAAVMPKLGYGSLMRGSSSDIEVPRAVYQDLSTWHRINFLYQHKELDSVKSWYPVSYEQDKIKILMDVLEHRYGHNLLNATEYIKRDLSDADVATYDQSDIDDSLVFDIERDLFESVIVSPLQQLRSTVSELLNTSGVNNTDIDMIYFTGGTSKVPAIHDVLSSMVPEAKVSMPDVFGSVGKGLVEYAKVCF